MMFSRTHSQISENNNIHTLRGEFYLYNLGFRKDDKLSASSYSDKLETEDEVGYLLLPY